MMNPDVIKRVNELSKIAHDFMCTPTYTFDEDVLKEIPNCSGAFVILDQYNTPLVLMHTPNLYQTIVDKVWKGDLASSIIKRNLIEDPNTKFNSLEDATFFLESSCVIRYVKDMDITTSKGLKYVLNTLYF